MGFDDGAIVDEQAGLALDKLSEAAIDARKFSDKIVQHQQRSRRHYAAHERSVRTRHGVLHCVAEQQKEGEIEGRHLPHFALAAQANAREDDDVDRCRPQQNFEDHMRAWN